MEVNHKWDDRQYGSIHGRSTGDAWNHILKNMINQNFLAEFDIAKCYDTIS